jgi:hypothetical protein
MKTEGEVLTTFAFADQSSCLLDLIRHSCMMVTVWMYFSSSNPLLFNLRTFCNASLRVLLSVYKVNVFGHTASIQQFSSAITPEQNTDLVNDVINLTGMELGKVSHCKTTNNTNWRTFSYCIQKST